MARTVIVVPCFDEAARFDAPAFDAYLSSGADVSFTLVNDGSTDGTLGVLRGLEQRWPGRVRVIDLQPNQGKAEAVRAGMLEAMRSGATYAGYFDADLATPLQAVAEFVATLDENPPIDLVIGARVALLGRHIERRALRHYLGRVFATAASLVLGLPVYDTQCGAKLFRVSPAARALFAQPFGSRWIFDVEIIARYLAGGGRREGLYELPLRQWTDVGESRVKSSDFLRAGGEMAAIYRSYRLRRDLDLLLRALSAPFLRYAGAGGVGTAIHYLTLTLLVTLAGVDPAAGTVAGALAGASVNYLLNYHFTFASRSPHRRTLPRFLAVAAASAALNGAGVWTATHRLGVHWLLAQALCTAGVLVIGYLLNRIWTFKTALAPLPGAGELPPEASTRAAELPAVDGRRPE